MRRFRSAIALPLAILAGCAGPMTPGPELAAARPSPEYILGAGDTLTVFVYRAPELSATDLPIRPDGRLSLPLVPDIQAAGRTPSALARDIEQKLRDYVREPSVTVMVRGFQGPPSRLIRVVGEVAQPMSAPYRDGLTLLDVIIGARGLTRFAAGNSATIIRRESLTGEAQPQPTRIPVRLADLLRDGDISQDVAMHPGDTLVIPQGWF
ncbi:MAG: polysaccharide export protein [Roseococcus sp.]|nr:polysaccharide export protein [Roseococcus sp.]